LVNNINGKSYIGSAVDLSRRFNEHFRGGNNSNIPLQKAFKKYGLSNFSFEVLEYCNEDELISKEQYYFNCFNPEYNIFKVAGNSLGYKHSTDAKLNIRLCLMGYYYFCSRPTGRLTLHPYFSFLFSVL
jgi:group I intron endonuclease